MLFLTEQTKKGRCCLSSARHILHTKTEFMRVIFLYTLLSFSAFGGIQAQSCYNSYNAMTGRVESDGSIRDQNNIRIGRFDTDGSVRDNANARIGKIERDGTVRNRFNSVLGRIEKGGTVRNKYNEMIGKVDHDGVIRNQNNTKIGIAQNVPAEKAGILFFFLEEMNR